MRIIIIGSSTGGPRVLFEIFRDLPLLDASIIIIQHMPASTTPRMARRLSELASVQVIIPESGDKLENGCIFLEKGDYHLILDHNEIIRLDLSDKVNFVRPSIDVTLLSLEEDQRYQFIGIILSGMGNDGTMGFYHLKRIGGRTIVQDPKTCIIKSMPEAAIKTGFVDELLTPQEIKELLISFRR